MKLSFHHSFYITFITLNTCTLGMQFSGPIHDQIDSSFSQLPLDTQIIVASYTNARTILNIQQTCRLWYSRLNSETKKKIVNNTFQEPFNIDQEFYDIALAATLSNFTTPEKITLFSKEPELFLLAGANPNYMNEIDGTMYTSTTLFINNSEYACTDEIKKVLKALIHHKADVNLWQRCYNQKTHEYEGVAYSALHYAVRKNATGMVTYLLAQKADINQKDFDGNTALHHAVTNLSYTMVKLLLDNNAATSLKNHYSSTAEQKLDAVELYDGKDMETFFKIKSLFDPSKKNIPAVQTIECSQQ